MFDFSSRTRVSVPAPSRSVMLLARSCADEVQALLLCFDSRLWVSGAGTLVMFWAGTGTSIITRKAHLSARAGFAYAACHAEHQLAGDKYDQRWASPVVHEEVRCPLSVARRHDATVAQRVAP